jgi:hypothetical protein
VIHLANDNIAWLADRHSFQCDQERLEFIASLLADSKYHFPLAEHKEGRVHCPTPTQRVSKAANERPASTLLPGHSYPGMYQQQI